MDSISESNFAYFFLSLLMEGAPFILLGTLVSGFIDVYMPSGMLEKVLPKRRLPAVLVCGLLGIVLPVCECAVVPVIRRLVAKGLPVSCAFTYMLAAPIVNPVTILSTWSAFSQQQALYVTLSRVGIGYLVAVAVGLLIALLPIEKVIRKSLLARISKSDKDDDGGCCSHDHDDHRHEVSCCAHEHADNEQHVGAENSCCGHQHGAETEQPKPDAGIKVVAAFRSASKDFVDVAVYFTIGVCLTVMFNILQVDYSEQIMSYADSEFKGTAVLMLLAFVLSVCSTSDAFLAASLGSFNYAAKMGFMVFGPMLDVKLLFLYQTVMTKRFLAIFCLVLFSLVMAICILWGRAEGLLEWSKAMEFQLFGEGGRR